jgi:phosphoribosylaminoimidazole carboxylase (NCAIR synthetase)
MHIVLVAPHFLENTNRYVRAFAQLDVELSIISEDPQRALPRDIQAAHYQVDSVGDPTDLARAVAYFSRTRGKVDRLTGVLEQLQMPMAHARAIAGVPGMKPDVARNFRDKDRMKEVLRKAGVPVAASALVTSQTELRAFVDRVGFPIIVKPQAGVGARSTYRVDDEAALAALDVGDGMQAEQFIRARELTCETITVNGKAVWRSGTQYFPSPLEVLETPWKQYCVMLPREIESPWTDFADVNSAALTALFGDDAEVSGTAITHMEWFFADGNKVYVNEVGARPPGVQIMPLMSLAHDVDMIAKWAELIAFDRFTPVARKFAAGAAFIRGQGLGDRVVEVRGIDDAIAKVGGALVELRAPRVNQLRAPGYEGEGIALVKSESTEGVKRALLSIIETVQVRYG